jgi:hypothetical protein
MLIIQISNFQAMKLVETDVVKIILINLNKRV